MAVLKVKTPRSIDCAARRAAEMERLVAIGRLNVLNRSKNRRPELTDRLVAIIPDPTIKNSVQKTVDSATKETAKLAKLTELTRLAELEAKTKESTERQSRIEARLKTQEVRRQEIARAKAKELAKIRTNEIEKTNAQLAKTEKSPTELTPEEKINNRVPTNNLVTTLDGKQALNQVDPVTGQIVGGRIPPTTGQVTKQDLPNMDPNSTPALEAKKRNELIGNDRVNVTVNMPGAGGAHLGSAALAEHAKAAKREGPDAVNTDLPTTGIETNAGLNTNNASGATFVPDDQLPDAPTPLGMGIEPITLQTQSAQSN